MSRGRKILALLQEPKKDEKVLEHDQETDLEDKVSTSSRSTSVISASYTDVSTDLCYNWPDSDSPPFSSDHSDYNPENSSSESDSSCGSSFDNKIKTKLGKKINENKNSCSTSKLSPEIPFQEKATYVILETETEISLNDSEVDAIWLREKPSNKSKGVINTSDKTLTIDMNSQLNKIVRAPDFCYFCESEVLNFGRHIIRNHSSEIEVQKIMSLPTGNINRKRLFTSLRKRGNHLRNIDRCIKPVKKSHIIVKDDSAYVPCKYCLGYYRPKQLWRHVKTCPQNNGQKTTFSHLTDSQSILVKHLSIDPQLRETVFPRMIADKVSMVAKKDLLICKFGSRYLKCHREKHLVNVCSRKMRELARLLIEIKKMNPGIKNLYDALKPHYFELFVEATKIVSNYDSTTEVFRSPTYAMNIQTSLKHCCDIAILFTLKRKLHSTIPLAEAESSFKTFKQLLEDAWRFEISTIAAADLSTKKWNKITILPLAADLKTFRHYLLKKADDALNALKVDKQNENAYKLLMETVFCRVLLLNRKRVGELERMPLHIYQNAAQHHSYEEFSEAITVTERILLTKFKRVVIRGKRGRGVPVLFSEDIQHHMSLLLDLRHNFVDESNIYLFPKVGTTNPITAYKIVNKHTKQSNLKNPDAITSTRLRKHLATLTQLFNMNSNDIEQLATSMGHTNDIHKQVYRLPDDIYQTVRISKLLMLMEKGKAGEFKGKTLDEIEMDDEVEFEEECDNMENGQDEYENEKMNQQQYRDRPSILSKEKKKSRILIPWTEEQKQLARDYFKKHIKNKKPPMKIECCDLKEKNHDKFDNKTWQQIKVFIQNTYSKK